MAKEINIENSQENTLFSDVCGIIDNSRTRVAVYVNSEICLTKWHVGKRIKENPLARQFYMEMCRIEHWDTRTLDAKIDSQLYERTAISRKPEEITSSISNFPNSVWKIELDLVA